MQTAQDYLAEKLQTAENLLKFSEFEANYWRKKYFDLMKANGKTTDDIEREMKKALTIFYRLEPTHQ